MMTDLDFLLDRSVYQRAQEAPGKTLQLYVDTRLPESEHLLAYVSQRAVPFSYVPMSGAPIQATFGLRQETGLENVKKLIDELASR